MVSCPNNRKWVDVAALQAQAQASSLPGPSTSQPRKRQQPLEMTARTLLRSRTPSFHVRECKIDRVLYRTTEHMGKTFFPYDSLVFPRKRELLQEDGSRTTSFFHFKLFIQKYLL